MMTGSGGRSGLPAVQAGSGTGGASVSEIPPESLVRRVIDQCAGCGLCHEMMVDAACRFFPRLFSLHERLSGHGREVTAEELRHLLDLCNACGQCPCRSVQAKIREAKDAFVARDGLRASVRLLENVRLIGRVCGAFPRLANLLVQNQPTSGLLKRIAGIHPDRRLPAFPREGFDTWARAKGLHVMRESEGRKVAYFTGCTARYMFPDVAKATVLVLEHNGITVHVPEQRCCGMPTMLEGDRASTFELADFNLPMLRRCVEAGYDIVTSCPTCGFMLKSVLCAGAHYADDYRSLLKDLAARTSDDFQAVSEELEREEKAFTGRVNAYSARIRQPWLLARIVRARMRHEICDDGYFASIPGRERILIATHTYELGEYLLELDREGELKRDLGPLPERMAYYPPCHLKEQDVGQPWSDLLALVPGMRMETVGGLYDCCGLGGIMGFKKEFHTVSLAMGQRLASKIRAADPDKVVTDCLSCRLQFNQMLPHPVAHPAEILCESYLAMEKDG